MGISNRYPRWLRDWNVRSSRLEPQQGLPYNARLFLQRGLKAHYIKALSIQQPSQCANRVCIDSHPHRWLHDRTEQSRMIDWNILTECPISLCPIPQLRIRASIQKEAGRSPYSGAKNTKILTPTQPWNLGVVIMAIRRKMCSKRRFQSRGRFIVIDGQRIRPRNLNSRLSNRI